MNTVTRQQIIKSAVKNLCISAECAEQALDNLAKNGFAFTPASFQIEVGLIQSKSEQKKNDRKFWGLLG